MTSPRHRDHYWTTRAAVDPAGVAKQLTGGVADINVPPPALTAALVIERGEFTTPAAPSSPTILDTNPHRQHRAFTVGLVELPVSDHGLGTEPEHLHE